MEVFNTLLQTFLGSLHWFYKSIIFELPWYQNYFWGLTIISILVWGLEFLFPWRKEQSAFRKDFWLDFFYMYFNFFLFAAVISGFYKLIGIYMSSISLSINALSIIDVRQMPQIVSLLVFFVVLDFVQWITHTMK